MTEVNNNYDTIEKQFSLIKKYIIEEEDPINLIMGYSELKDINDNLKAGKDFGNTIITTLLSSMTINAFHCLDKEKNKKELVNFIFGFGQNNLDTFLNNEQIDDQDKFFALVTKYAIISQLPNEFKDTQDKEMDLLYNHIEEVSKNCANHIEKNGWFGNNKAISNSLTTITNNIFSTNNRTNYEKDVKFIIDIYRNIPFLTKDRTINHQGQPVFNELIQRFLNNPHKNNNVLNFVKDTIQNDPSCIYKFSTTKGTDNLNYEEIEKNKDFSGNFICNFPDLLDENGIHNGDRCNHNILSETLYALSYKELPEDIREDVIEMLNYMLEFLSSHIKSLRDSGNIEELQKINYLLNCSIEDPNTGKIVTPMDLINNLRKKGVINITKEQMEQFRSGDPVCLLQRNEIDALIETKKIMKQNRIEELQNELEIKKTTRTSKVAHFFGKKTKQEKIIEEEIKKTKQAKLSEQPSNFSSIIKKQTSKQNISRPQSRQEKFANRGNNGNSNEIPFP